MGKFTPVASGGSMKSAGQSNQKNSHIQVIVANGDLRYSSFPVIAGHFLNDGILYAEKAIDRNLQGAMSEKQQLGIYPGDIGSSEVFHDPTGNFAGALIIGLGQQGSLTAYQLSRSVERGASRYILEARRKKFTDSLGISSLIIGCGYGGLTVDNSVRAIIQGVQQANEKLQEMAPDVFPLIEIIEFIEQYEDRALSCFYSVKKIENEEGQSLRISLGGKKIRQLLGSKKRLPADSTEEWWTRINVFQHTEKMASTPEDGKITGTPTRSLGFSASTGGAREEGRETHSSSRMLDELLSAISSTNNWNPDLAKSFFELLIPNDFKEQLKRQHKINWILDKHTAEYPWELLQDSASGTRPLCVNAGMIRQLRTHDFRVSIRAATKNSALVIGDPELSGSLEQLPGARLEAIRVAEILESAGYTTTSLINTSSLEIIKRLFKEDYKIIHLAGHGVFDEKNPEASGMVIGNNMFLSTKEFCKMSSVPELVFVNSCFLGKTSAAAEAYYRDRYKLAANIGTQLIENGVRAVIVAGWAIDDNAALEFTKIFYEKMMDGDSLGDAMLCARRHIYSKYHHNNNTWGAYQCYGDPHYRLKINKPASREYHYNFDIDDQAEIELYNLRNTIETGNYGHETMLNILDAINKAVDINELRTPEITEQEALIYADLYEYQKSIEKFESLLKMDSASFKISTLERYCNIRAKQYVLELLNGSNSNEHYLTLMNSLIQEVEVLFALSPTTERYLLMGSTLKRKAYFICDPADKIQVLKESAYNYMRAYDRSGSIQAMINWFQLEAVLVLLEERRWSQDISMHENDYKLPPLVQIEEILQKALDENRGGAYSYFEMGRIANIQLCRIICQATEGESAGIESARKYYYQIWKRAGSKGKKYAEIEHIDLIIDAIRISSGSKAKKLTEDLCHLKTSLLNILES